MDKLKAYINDVIKEMRKVNWPKRNELVANTGIVLVGTFIIGLIIFAADRAISAVLSVIYG